VAKATTHKSFYFFRSLFSLCGFDFCTACQNCKATQTEDDCGNHEIKTPAAEAASILQVSCRG
jgi:hypothetical protein